MPAQKRHKTKYAGVYYIEGKAIGSNKTERIYYITYRRNGKQIHEKAGRTSQDDMTPARASGLRADRIAGKEPTNKERRKSERAAKLEAEGKWTIDRLFRSYIETRPNNKSRVVDTLRYDKYLKVAFGPKEAKDLVPLDVDRLRIKLLKKLAPQTVKHILNLLTWTINYGVKKSLCSGISFHIQKPTVHNQKTEDLNSEELASLLKAINADHNIQVKNMMKMALFTGMRRGELFKLKWSDINFDRGFITIVDPKGGPDQSIPMDQAARKILDSHPRSKSPFVFPGRGGQQRVSAQADVNRIKKRAGLPKDFRPLHGLRHVYASMLASSGQVDMYTLQKLLTHKSPLMTQRYAHLRDETLKKASSVAADIITQASAESNDDKVVNWEDRKN